jgi:formylglycine-generating enzyme required for sulfatase activity
MCFATAIVNAQTITQNFGSGANAFSIDFVEIGNPGNAPDTTGSPNPAGSVAYTYNIAKYEVSREMIDKANADAGLGITLQDMTNYGGNGVNKPATGISWYGAAKFVNYLNIISGSTAAYKFDASGNFQLWSTSDVGFNPNNPFRNSVARYFLPSSPEWYKAAYGSPNGTWYDYATGSDVAPTPVSGGTEPNTAVYAQLIETGPSDITYAGGLSAYGTMAQGGNVWEWTETAHDGLNNDVLEYREERGAGWGDFGSHDLASFDRDNVFPTDEGFYVIGFRVASVPEPSALSLLAIGLGGMAVMRHRRS